MKNTNEIIIGLLVIISSCSSPNSKHIDKIQQQVKVDAMGVEMNYKSIEFQWTDTIVIRDELSSLQDQYSDILSTILDIDFYIKDEFVESKIFTIDYLTKDRITELRNWESIIGHPKDILGWDEEGYVDYYEYAVANRGATTWLTDYCNQVEETDSLLTNYEELEDGNLDLIQNALWYYNRIDKFRSNNNPSEIWGKVELGISEMKNLNNQIDSLSQLDSEEVIHYKALNTYKINNPILNGAEQELKKYFLFNREFEIIGKEEFNKE